MPLLFPAVLKPKQLLQITFKIVFCYFILENRFNKELKLFAENKSGNISLLIYKYFRIFKNILECLKNQNSAYDGFLAFIEIA